MQSRDDDFDKDDDGIFRRIWRTSLTNCQTIPSGKAFQRGLNWNNTLEYVSLD